MPEWQESHSARDREVRPGSRHPHCGVSPSPIGFDIVVLTRPSVIQPEPVGLRALSVASKLRKRIAKSFTFFHREKYRAKDLSRARLIDIRCEDIVSAAPIDIYGRNGAQPDRRELRKWYLARLAELRKLVDFLPWRLPREIQFRHVRKRRTTGEPLPHDLNERGKLQRRQARDSRRALPWNKTGAGDLLPEDAPSVGIDGLLVVHQRERHAMGIFTSTTVLSLIVEGVRSEM